MENRDLIDETISESLISDRYENKIVFNLQIRLLISSTETRVVYEEDLTYEKLQKFIAVFTFLRNPIDALNKHTFNFDFDEMDCEDVRCMFFRDFNTTKQDERLIDYDIMHQMGIYLQENELTQAQTWGKTHFILCRVIKVVNRPFNITIIAFPLKTYEKIVELIWFVGVIPNFDDLIEEYTNPHINIAKTIAQTMPQKIDDSESTQPDVVSKIIALCGQMMGKLNEVIDRVEELEEKMEELQDRIENLEK